MNVANVIDLNWSPDGLHLAYSVANCNEDGLVETASVYVWDSETNTNHLLFTNKGMLLHLEEWTDNSTLRVLGEIQIDLDTIYNVYTYNIINDQLIFSGTATPHP